MARRKSQDPAEKDGGSFEESLAKLEEIVEAMENQQLPLEELVRHYETGSELLRSCDAFLKSARDRIELITLRAAAADATDDSSPAVQSGSAGEPDDDDEIRLF